MQIEFYKIIAQIIPLLFFGLTLQSVFLLKHETYNKEGGDIFRRNIHIMVVGALVLLLSFGEFIALRNVYRGLVGQNDLPVTISILGMSVFYIVLEFILALLNKSKGIFFGGFMLLGVLLVMVIFLI